jgi:hypothetical protein
VSFVSVAGATTLSAGMAFIVRPPYAVRHCQRLNRLSPSHRDQRQMLILGIVARPGNAGHAMAKALAPGQAVGLDGIALPMHLRNHQSEDVIEVVE